MVRVSFVQRSGKGLSGRYAPLSDDPREIIDGWLKSPPRTGETCIAGRFPYTYACDHVRQRDRNVGSRAEASGLIRTVAQDAGIDAEILFIALAYAYLREHGIEKP